MDWMRILGMLTAFITIYAQLSSGVKKHLIFTTKSRKKKKRVAPAKKTTLSKTPRERETSLVPKIISHDTIFYEKSHF
ncbi:hypothetical protein [Bacillus sp. 'calajunan']|uniref:hypothetical protein n=1 Tax=Bacillus sp. 'calajunan' TaxID=3447457 RepID=UPI003EE24692